jgi:hypothetical protein
MAVSYENDGVTLSRFDKGLDFSIASVLMCQILPCIAYTLRTIQHQFKGKKKGAFVKKLPF